MRLASRLCVLVGVLIGLCSSNARAGFLVDMTFNDPGSIYSGYYDQIAMTVQAAADQWGSRIVSSGSMSLQINFTNEPTASAGGKNFVQVGTDGDLRIMQSGALAAITTGRFTGMYDAVLNIGANYLINTLWFDPDPISRSAPIPSMRIDALTVFMHEIGHMLFMTGWRDRTTGELPGVYASTFDQHVITDGEDFYFNGPRAVALYGGPVPLTYGNLMHLGNYDPRPGSDLIPDLMNGVVRYYQRRYDISDLDLAIAADTGILLYADLPSVAPEPSALALLGAGILIVGLHRRVALRRERAALKERQGDPNQ